MNPTSFSLSLEQQFEIQKIRQEADSMSREQALDLLLNISRNLMLKDNLIRDLMRKSQL